jgi:hypothetical protein
MGTSDGDPLPKGVQDPMYPHLWLRGQTYIYRSILRSNLENDLNAYLKDHGYQLRSVTFQGEWADCVLERLE